MRTLLYHGASRLTVGESPTPHAGPGEVRVRIDSVGLCRSDLYGYSGRNNRRDDRSDPTGPRGFLTIELRTSEKPLFEFPQPTTAEAAIKPAS